MVAGHLQEKNGRFYMVLNYKDGNDKRKVKWIHTGLPVRGNKKKAEALLMEARKTFEPEAATEEPDMLFADFMLYWLEVMKPNIELISYASYGYMIKGTIVPYFKETGVMLRELRTKDIQDFYLEQLKRVKAATVIHYHANIHKALKFAVRMGMISANPAANVERPKKEIYVGGFYGSEELNRLFDVVKGTSIELAVLFGAYYGLRRSEIVGLRWDAIDLKNDTLVIRHTVTAGNIDGKIVEMSKDRAKNKASLRTLPLMPMFKKILLKLKEDREHYRRLCGKSYCTDYLDYIYVDALGVRIKPNYITWRFRIILNQNGMRKIRFHDLRHSCASLLLANGVPMKQIQEWLGHSDFSTTANIYAHLDYQSKMSSMQAILDGMER